MFTEEVDAARKRKKAKMEGRKKEGRKEVDRSTDPRTERKTERQMRLSTHLSMTCLSFLSFQQLVTAGGKSPHHLQTRHRWW